MQEVIGKVRLNLDYYSGRDLYDEGASEDEILEIVKNVAPCDYNRIINERKSWSVLYHLSNIRGNIVSFLPGQYVYAPIVRKVFSSVFLPDGISV